MGISALRRYERQGVTKLEDVTPKIYYQYYI